MHCVGKIIGSFRCKGLFVTLIYESFSCWSRFLRAVIARELAETNIEVQVIDKRTHIGGNCFDYVDSLDQRIHKYGPHLAWLRNSVAIRWLSKFTDWVPYEHRKALLPDGRLTSTSQYLNIGRCF